MSPRGQPSGQYDHLNVCQGAIPRTVWVSINPRGDTVNRFMEIRRRHKGQRVKPLALVLFLVDVVW